MAWVRRKNLRTKVVGISSLASTEPEILLGVIYPLLATYVIRDTLAIAGLKIDSINKFWHTQELKYNWQVEITGTGSRSLVL